MKAFINKLLLLSCLLVSVYSCSEDSEAVEDLTNKGQVVFQFTKTHLYEVSQMEDIGSIMVTIEKDGEKSVLPSMPVNGTVDSLYTPAFALEKGEYRVLSFKIFGKNASKIADIDLDENNQLVIEDGKLCMFDLFVEIKVVYDVEVVRNVMIGICKEVFGDDKSSWPIDPTEEDLRKWPCFEFDVDQATEEIITLTSVVFDASFQGMKRLPQGLSSLATVDAVILRDFDLEELPSDLADMVNLGQLRIENTNLKSLPANLGRSRLKDLIVVNSDITEFPVELCEMKDLRLLEISGNKLTSLPQEIEKLQGLVQIRIQEPGITQLPNAFADLDKLDLLDLRHCSVSDLPTSIAEAGHLKTLFLDSCSFTTIPHAVAESPSLLWLTMRGNEITQIDASRLPISSKINTVDFSDNKISELPTLHLPDLQMLAINNCELTEVPSLSSYSQLIQFEMQNNPITSIPDACFVGTRIRKINFSNNDKLTSAPLDFGVSQKDGVPTTLYSLEVENCPSLQWTIPPTWEGIVIISQ